MMARCRRSVIQASLLAFLTLTGCFLGCAWQFKPIPIEEAQIPEGIKKRIEDVLYRDFSSVTDLTWCILDEYEGGLFVVATFRGNPRQPTTGSQSDTDFYVWGHLRRTVEGTESEWSGPVFCRPLRVAASPSCPAWSSFQGEVFPGGSIVLRYAVGWVTYPQAEKVQLIRSDGLVFNCAIKNGFWWTGPHEWGNFYPEGCRLRSVR